MAAEGDQIVEVSDGFFTKICQSCCEPQFCSGMRDGNNPKRTMIMCNKVRRKFHGWWNNIGCNWLKSLGKMVGRDSTLFRIIVGRKRKLHSKNGRLAMLSVIATSVDPLFFYILFVNEDRRCIGFHDEWKTAAVILRSVIDFLYAILTAYYFHDGYPLLNDETDGVLVRARKFLLSSSRVDLLAFLPLPQLLALLVIPRSKGLHFIHAIRALNYVVLVQYLSRVIRIYSFLMKSGWSTILPQAAEARATFNLILYMLATHVVGAFWYLSTIERKTMCWHGRCHYCPLNCNYVLIANNADDFCSEQAENDSKTYDFGVFKDALPILNSRDFIWKISYCFWWSLQKLSSFGQDLKTSGHLLEIYFAITITISGLVLFALLIGNLQTYLQSTIRSKEKIRLKEQDIENCMTNYSIPDKLKTQVRKCKLYKQREAKGVGVEQLLQNLPNHISRDIKEHLCSTSLFNVLLKLDNMDKILSDAIYDLLKPKRYIEQTFIVQEGGPVDEVVFIIQGKVLVSSKKDSKPEELNRLTKGHFYGEELVD